MAFQPQNFVDQVGPVVSAQFLNGLDLTCNQGLNGLNTQAAIAAWLGVPTGASPLPISLGGTGQSSASAALAALGGISLNGATIPQTPAEISAAVAVTDQRYPPGNLLRYGVVPNDPSSAASNQTILGNLLQWSTLNGPTGLIYSPNTGLGSPDTYYFSGATNTIRDGVVLDLGGTTWNFTKTSAYSDNNNGFLWCLRNVTIQNGNIVASYADGGGPGTGGVNPGPGGTQRPGSFGVIFMGGRDASVTGSNLPTIFDSLPVAPQTVAAQLGNIVFRNLTINGTSTIPVAGMYGIIGLGGINKLIIDNVAIEGNGVLINGLYYEFGWATNPPGAYTHQRQTSHAHDWIVNNFTVTNTSLASTSNGGLAMNGAYNIVCSNVHVSNSPTIVGFGTGESMFLQPWIGVDDFGSLSQNGSLSPLVGNAAAGRNITLRNITGRQIKNTGISVGGNTFPSPWAGTPAWLPNTVYVAGGTPSVVYNGAYKYTCTVGGTSSNTAGFAGPRGTSGSITDGGVTWSYTASATGTGYNGYQVSTAYVPNDVTINGQYMYLCTVGGTTAVSSQGPTGVGTAIVDGAVTWKSVPTSSGTAAPANSAWPACVDQLNLTLDGFTVDSGTTGTLSGGYGVTFDGGTGAIRNGKITNMSRGISIGGDVTQITIDLVTVLNCGGVFGMQISGPAPSNFTPPRLMQGAIRNCFIAGTSTAGAAPGYGIVLSQCQSFLIENNRFGYELIHDGIAEPTQQYAVFLPVFSGAVSPYNGVICRSNYVNCAGGGSAYFMYPGTSFNCAIDDPVGPVQTYSGGWEGVLQSTTPTITCDTPGNLAITYDVQAFDYIKRGQKVDFTMRVSTSAFTWTTASGAVRITGLPYAMNNSVVGSQPTLAMTFQGITKAGYTQFTANSSGAQTYMNISAAGSAQTLATLQIGDIPTAGTVKILISGHYFTSI